MATKSILANVRFKDRTLCRGLANALENAQDKKSKEVVLSRTCKAIPKDKIKDFFRESK